MGHKCAPFQQNARRIGRSSAEQELKAITAINSADSKTRLRKQPRARLVTLGTNSKNGVWLRPYFIINVGQVVDDIAAKILAVAASTLLPCALVHREGPAIIGSRVSRNAPFVAQVPVDHRAADVLALRISANPRW